MVVLPMRNGREEDSLSAFEDDVDRIMRVMQSAFEPDFGEAWSRRQVLDALTLGNCHYALLTAAGTSPDIGDPAAGFFLSRYGYQEEELLLLAVEPDCRGRGLGRKLLNLFEAEARARGARRLLLEMRRGNPAGQLYETVGFKVVGDRKNYYRAPTGQRFDAVTYDLEVI